MKHAAFNCHIIVSFHMHPGESLEDQWSLQLSLLYHSTLQKCDEEGAKVIATDINLEKLKELQQERPSIIIDTLNVTKGKDVEHILKEKYPDVNVLFNCAG